MTKINWGMTNVRIFPFIGTSNTFYFSVNGILSCIKVVTEVIQGLLYRTHFFGNKSLLWQKNKKKLKHFLQYSEKIMS